MEITKKSTTSPLVSVCIITYNSSKYIQEALESVYNQTYHNIELIISDDGSGDDTVEIAERWLLNKRDRFTEVKVLTVEKNTGTAKNCNRGLSASKGEWFKYFAGDDILLPNAIEEYMNFVNKRPDVKWVWAKAIRYNEEISDKHIMTDVYDYEKIKSIFEKSRITQFRRLVINNFIWYPTHFLRKSLLESIGGFDENFGIYEDYPTWLRLYRNGEQCFFLDVYTIGYRYSVQSVVNNPGFLLNKKIRQLAFVARRKFALDKLTWVEQCGTYILYGLDMFFSISFMNKNTIVRRRIRGGITISVRKILYFLQLLVRI